MDASIALDSLTSPRKFACFQNQVIRGENDPELDDLVKLGYTDIRDDTQFIFHADKCCFPETDKLPQLVAEAKNYSAHVKRSPFYKYLFCPNLARFFKGLPVFRTPHLLKVLGDSKQVQQTRRVKVLYPGAGSHLAVLDLANYIYEQKYNSINLVEFIFTDISPRAIKDTRTLLAGLKYENVYTDVKEQTRNFSHGGTETTFTFKYQGREVRLVYALNMSGEAYYRDTDLIKSDLVVVHDPGTSGCEQSSVQLLTSIFKSLSQGTRTEVPLVLIEDVSDYADLDLWPTEFRIHLPEFFGHRNQYKYCQKPYFACHRTAQYIKLPDGKGTLEREIGMRFWEIGKPKYRGLILRPDSRLLRGLGTKEITSIIDLSIFERFDEASSKYLTADYDTFTQQYEHAGFVARELKQAPRSSRDYDYYFQEQQKLNRYFGQQFSFLQHIVTKIPPDRPYAKKLLTQATQRSYQRVSKVCPDCLVKANDNLEQGLRYRISETRKGLPSPPVRQHVLGSWSGLGIGRSLLGCGLFNYPQSLLEKPLFFPDKNIGYTYIEEEPYTAKYNLPVYRGLYSSGKFIGLVRTQSNRVTVAPDYYQLSQWHLKPAKPIDLIQFTALQKSDYYLVFSPTRDFKMVRLIKLER